MKNNKDKIVNVVENINLLNERKIYIDIIKIIAIIGVIFIHVSAAYFYVTPIESNKWKAMNLWNVIGRFGVPIFLMCSGVLFLNKKELTYKNLLKKYIPRLIIAFLAWNFIYALYKTDFNLRNIITVFKNGLACVHLWFIILIIGIYLLLPIIRIVINNSKKRDIQYLLIVLFILQSLIPFLSSFEKLSWINPYYKYLYTNRFIGYIGIFIWGYYIDKYELNTNKKVLIYIFGIISVISTILLNLLKTSEISTATVMFSNETYPNIIIYSTAIFIAIKEICNKINIKEKIGNLIAKVGSLIFGIYLIHMLVLNILNMFKINSLMCNVFISIPIVSIIVFMISLVLVFIISKIPILKKIVL